MSSRSRAKGMGRAPGGRSWVSWALPISSQLPGQVACGEVSLGAAIGGWGWAWPGLVGSLPPLRAGLRPG